MGIYGENAEKYYKAGLNPIPCVGKKVFVDKWNEWCRRSMTEDEFDQLTENHSSKNIGITLGPYSGIVAFDLDYYMSPKKPEKSNLTDEQYKKIYDTVMGEEKKIKEEIIALLPYTPCVKYSIENKKTFFYKAKGNFQTIGVDRYGQRLFDILWDGKQTVIPPSIHPDTNKPYKWINGDLAKHIEDLPEISWELIQVLAEKYKRSLQDLFPSITTTNVTGRNDALKRLAWGMFARGMTIEAVTNHLLILDKEQNSTPLFSDKDEYPSLYKTPEKAALRFASNIMRAFRDKMINQKPTDEQLKNTLEKMKEEEFSHEIIGEIEEKPTKKNEIELVSLKDLLERPDEQTPYLVEGLLPAGGTSIVAAKPKVGKTTLLRQLSLAVSKGELFLNRKCSQGPVIYFSVEEKIDEIKSHFKSMGADGTEPIYIFANRAPQDTIAKLKPIIEQIKPSLIILDTLFKVVRMKDANDYASISSALEPIQELARESGAHIMCVHHAGKADRDGADGILGSTAILGAFDTAIIMARQNKKRTIKTIQRYGQDLDESVLFFDDVTRRSSLGQETWKEKADERTSTLIGFLREVGQPVTFQDIKEGTGMDRDILRTTLQKLVDKKIVSVRGSGIKKDPKTYFLGLF